MFMEDRGSDMDCRERVVLGGSTLAELEKLCQFLGEPRYRAKQIYRWIYSDGVTSVEEMTNLPKRLRQNLASYDVLPVSTVLVRQSVDGTRKYLFRLRDGQLIETVMIPEEDRITVCVSTQVGCAMGCAFCATGQSGYVRNLSSSEIVGQVLAVRSDLMRRVSNIVFMGMGEPLQNYDSVMASIDIFNDPKGLAIGMRHITISTCGVAPGIRRLADERLQLVLAISLHATTDEERQKLMPIARKYPLNELMSACRYYAEKTGRRITFEYALIAGVNDDAEAAGRLVKLLRGIPAHVNLIPMNPVAGTELNRSSESRIAHFAEILGRSGVSVTIRQERGTDIEAACGQLRGSYAKIR